MTRDQKDNLIQAIKFTLFSASAGAIQFGSYTLLFEVAKLSHWPAYLISLLLSVIWNFTLNRKFTFKSANNVAIAMLKVLGYYLVFTPLSTWWNAALSDLGWNNYVLEIGTMLINFVTEFLFCKFVVYRNSINTAVKKDEKPEGEPQSAGDDSPAL